MAASDFQVTGKNTKALFALKLHRGDGMCLVAMNWKNGKPPNDFVGFAIESKPPGGDTFFPLEQPPHVSRTSTARSIRFSSRRSFRRFKNSGGSIFHAMPISTVSLPTA